MVFINNIKSCYLFLAIEIQQFSYNNDNSKSNRNCI